MWGGGVGRDQRTGKWPMRDRGRGVPGQGGGVEESMGYESGREDSGEGRDKQRQRYRNGET